MLLNLKSQKKMLSLNIVKSRMFLWLLTYLIGSVIIVVVKSDLPSCEVWSYHKNAGLFYRDDCGLVKVNNEIRSRIAHGRAVTRGLQPWMAYIRIKSGKKSFYCGGSVINDYYILTAAHCLAKDNPVVTVILGLHDKYALDKHTKTYAVEKYIKHFDYKVIAPGKNDIALLRLQKKISFKSPFISYICLPFNCSVATSSFIGQKATLAGWGIIREGIKGRTLRTMNVPVVKCDSYTLRGKDTSPDEMQMCTSDRKSEACHGDSGGPLVFDSPDTGAVQVGVFSFGQVNCYTNQSYETDYYMNVTSYMDWILDNVEP